MDCPVCGIIEEEDLALCKGVKPETATPSNAVQLSAGDVKKLIDELPTADELAVMSLEEQQEVYEKLQATYEAYNALTEEQKEEVIGAEIFDSLFDVFNGMMNTLANEEYNINDKPVTIDDSCGDNCSSHKITGNGQTTNNTITVEGGTHNITLQDVNIQVSDNDSCAFKLEDNAKVNLTFSGTNVLKSGTYCAGLQVPDGTTLTITGDETGSLTAIGGYYGAGIGSGGSDIGAGNGGNITINGGRVIANGGGLGAGIGGTSPAEQTTTGKKVTSLPTSTQSGYSFNGWYTAKTGGDKITLDTVFSASVTVYAQWTKNSGGGGGGGSSYTEYTITATAGAGGSISPSYSVGVREGRDKTFTITPDGGYYIFDVLVDGQSVGAVSSYTFENVEAQHTIEVVFAKGNSETRDAAFKFYAVITRAQIAVLLYHIDGSPEVTGDSPFTDVAYGPGTEWYYDAVLWASQKGIAAGYGDNTYHPEDPVTCEQLAVMFYNYAGYKGYDLIATRDLSGFTDAGSVSDWAVEAVKWAVGSRLMKGCENGALTPQKTATRAEAGAMLHNFIERNYLVPPAGKAWDEKFQSSFLGKSS